MTIVLQDTSASLYV